MTFRQALRSFWTWLKDNLVRVLILAGLIIVIIILWPSDRDSSDEHAGESEEMKNRTEQSETVDFLVSYLQSKDTVDVDEVAAVFASVEYLAGKIYDRYVYEGHAGSMNDPKKMVLYEDMKALIGDLDQSIEDYVHFRDTYSEERELVMRIGIIVLVQEYLDVLEKTKDLEGYEKTADKRKLLFEKMAVLRPS